jgi:hypothetical protein
VTGDEAVIAMIDALNASGTPYMLVGSLSSNYYGVARATRDADFVVQFSNEAAAEIARRLGPSIILDPQIQFETITGTSRYVARLADHPFKIELFLLSEDAHDQERFDRRRPARILDREAFIPTPEDVLITKLRWSRRGKRAKDIEDVRNVISVQASRLDWEYVHKWCREHGTRDLLDELRRSIPAI